MMPVSAVLLFFFVSLAIFSLLHFYLLRRFDRALQSRSVRLRRSITAVFVFLALLYPFGRMAGGAVPPAICSASLWIGGLYLGWLVYMILGLLALIGLLSACTATPEETSQDADWIARIAGDMRLPHEGRPQGVPDSFDWSAMIPINPMTAIVRAM